jgi:hypothetical protein
MKSNKSDVAILTGVLCDMDNSIATLRNYRNVANFDSSVDAEKRFLRFQKIILQRLNDLV